MALSTVDDLAMFRRLIIQLRTSLIPVKMFGFNLSFLHNQN